MVYVCVCERDLAVLFCALRTCAMCQRTKFLVAPATVVVVIVVVTTTEHCTLLLLLQPLYISLLFSFFQCLSVCLCVMISQYPDDFGGLAPIFDIRTC